MPDKEDNYDNVRHGGTEALKKRGHVWENDASGRKFTYTLPKDFRLANRRDFYEVNMGSPYLVWSALYGHYQAYRIGKCWPWDGFWKLVDLERVYVRKGSRKAKND